MTTRSLHSCYKFFFLIIAIAAWPAMSSAQVPVDESEDLPVLTSVELEGLIGPIALYPDDLLAIVLPASTFPFQIVEAARFLEKLESDASLEPDDDWDDSVVALTNYPEVVELLNEDLDWTWRLGEAVVAQQADVIAAIETFRDRAYAAGNLKSDDYQTVTEEDGVIEITPVEEDVIYVPYYEPEQVVVYQPRPVYYYYPRAYPLYYYPYPYGYAFNYNFFWGVTTAYSIGWYTNHLHVHHHSYHGHRYYGHSYWDRYWYRAPDIHVHNNTYVNNYVNNYVNVSTSSYGQGDYWQPQPRRTVRSSDQRITRTRYYPNSSSRSQTTTNSYAGTRNRPKAVRSSSEQRFSSRGARRSARSEIEFRDRSDTPRKTTTPRTAQREPVEKRTSTQFRRSQERQAQPRQTQVREAPTRQVQRRQTQVREAPTRQVQPRQTQVRAVPTRQAQPRQTQVRAVPTRQAQPKQVQSRQSPPKQSQSKPSQSRSTVKVARNSRSYNSNRDH